MTGLSDVSILIGQRAADLEKAREIFTAESRAFVVAILTGIRRARSEPWTLGRVRIDIPREIENESKSGGYITSQFAFARANLRFKKGTLFTVVAEIRFGIEFDEAEEHFVWTVVLVPSARYQRIDDVLWGRWRATVTQQLPGAIHQDRANTVRFASRPIGPELTPELAFNDVKTVLEFVVGADAVLAEAVGLDPTPDDQTD